MPVPAWVTAPDPEMTPANVYVSDRLNRRAALSVTFPATDPVVPPAPSWRVPAETVVPPVYVFAPDRTQSPAPDLARASVVVGESASAPAIVLAPVLEPVSVSVRLSDVNVRGVFAAEVVAAALRVNPFRVPPTEATVAPAGMPVPLTGIPTAMPVRSAGVPVDERATKVLPLVTVKLVTALSVAGSAPVFVNTTGPVPEESRVPPAEVTENSRSVLAPGPVYCSVPPFRTRLPAALGAMPMPLGSPAAAVD